MAEIFPDILLTVLARFREVLDDSLKKEVPDLVGLVKLGSASWTRLDFLKASRADQMAIVTLVDRNAG